MIRLDVPYVDPDRTLTQAGYEVLKGQDRRIDTLEAADALEATNAPGTAPRYACRAWVNFNGTGTVAIRASGNVSSITDNGAGDYTVNFATAMTDADYSCALATEETVVGQIAGAFIRTGGKLAGSLRIKTWQWTGAGGAAGAYVDPPIVDVAVFR